MTASLGGFFTFQGFTSAGALGTGMRLYTYVQGTTTQKTAYTDAAASIAHTYTSDGLGGQYIALNSRGELPAPLYLTTGSYDIVLKDSSGSTIWTRRADSLADVLSAFVDLTTTGNTVLGSTGANTLNVAAGALTVSGGLVGVGRTASGRTLDVQGAQGAGRLTSSVGTNPSFWEANNTGGQAVFGRDDSLGALFGQTAYMTAMWANGTSDAGIFTNTTLRMKFSGTNGDVTAQGVALTRSKAAATTRSSTTTLADDPDLIVPLTVGRWNVKVWVPLYTAVAGTGGFKCQLAFSGTAASSLFAYRGILNNIAVSDVCRALGAAVESSATIAGANAAAPEFVVYEGSLTVSVAGNLSFQWAQSSSNVAAVTVATGAFAQCTKAS